MSFEYISFILLIVSMVAIISAGYRITYKWITYPTSDTCVLFNLADSISKMIYLNRCSIHLEKFAPVDQFNSKEIYIDYNLFLNIIKNFPPDSRLKLTQKLNFIFHALYITVMGMICYLLALENMIDFKFALGGGRYYLHRWREYVQKVLLLQP